MAITAAQVDMWRTMPKENQRLEFKEAKSQFDTEKLFRYAVAMANEGGGHLLLGIADEPPRPVVGTQAFQDPVTTAEKLFNKLRFRVDVEEVRHPDGRVVVFQFPSRPRGTAYALEGAYWMRSGSELVTMSEDQLRRIFAEGEPDWLEEPAATDLDAQQVVELLDTQAFFELLKRPYPTQRQGVIELLVKEELIDEGYGTFSIRRLGALLFAKRLPDFPELSRKAPRVIVFSGVDKLQTKLDQTGARGYAVGFQGLVQLVMQQLPQNEILQGALRTEVKLLPEEIIRELVANALIHQDFDIGGASVMIEVFSNRVEISNPGEPLVPVDRMIDGFRSRNDRLADLMRRMGICEEKGSGIDRVVKSAEDYQLPAPDFRAGYLRTEMILYGLKRFEEMDREARVRACYQHCALQWVARERMTNQSLRLRFHLPERKSNIVSQIIAAAVADGKIKQDESAGGSKKFARYLPFWA